MPAQRAREQTAQRSGSPAVQASHPCKAQLRQTPMLGLSDGWQTGGHAAPASSCQQPDRLHHSACRGRLCCAWQGCGACPAALPGLWAVWGPSLARAERRAPGRPACLAALCACRARRMPAATWQPPGNASLTRTIWHVDRALLHGHALQGRLAECQAEHEQGTNLEDRVTSSPGHRRTAQVHSKCARHARIACSGLGLGLGLELTTVLGHPYSA